MPGGRQIVAGGTEPGKGFRLYLVDVGSKAARPLLGSGLGSFVPSPDGSRVAAWSLGGIKIYPVGGGEPSAARGTILEEIPIQWRADGRALYLARFNQVSRVIDEVDLATGRRQRWKEVFLADNAGSTTLTLLMTPDGKAYAYDVRSALSALYLVEGLR
jgi:hypothetical protein